MKEKEELKMKAEAINSLIEGIVNEEIDLPDKSFISLDFEATLNIFTKKRMEIIDCINKYNPRSVQDLAEITKRMKQAVDRDLTILERYEIVELKKEGRTVIPTVKREVILFNLKKPQEKTPEVVFSCPSTINLSVCDEL